MLASMVNDFANASPVRVPSLVRQDFGEGWAALHEAAALHGRHPRQEVMAWLRWAAWHYLQGDDTELTRAQLGELFESLQPLEPVA